MKACVFFVCAFAVIGSLTAAPRDETDLAEKVMNVVNEILAIIPESIALKDDVFEIPPNDIESGKFTVEEISVRGFKALDSDVKYDAGSTELDYTFNWKDIAFVFDISMDIKGLIDVDHHLSVIVEITNLKNEGFAKVNEEKKEITDFNLLATVEKINFDIKGLFNNDEISKDVSDFLTENVARVIEEINPVIAPYFSKVVKDIINVALKIEH